MNKKRYLLKGLMAIIILLAIMLGYNNVLAEGEEEVVEEVDPIPSLPYIADLVTDDPKGYDGPYNTIRVDKNGNQQMVYFDWNDNMPPLVKGATGTMPQYYSTQTVRTVRLGKSRRDLGTTEWNAKVDGYAIYCADYGAAIKRGHYDPEKRYLTAGSISLGENGTINSFVKDKSTLEKRQEAAAKALLDDLCEEYEDASQHNVRGYAMFYPTYAYGATQGSSYEIYYDPDGVKDAYAIPIDSYLGAEENPDKEADEYFKQEASDTAVRVLQKILAEADGEKMEKATDDDSTDGTARQEDVYLGLNINIMETEDRAEDHYQVSSEVGEFSTSSTEKTEIEKAYILTALEEVYNYESGVWKPSTEELAKMYNLNDIQTAYWYVLGDEGKNAKNVRGSNRTTTKGIELYNKAVEYANFVTNDLKDYESKVKVNGELATFEVKVKDSSRNNVEYISGPYTIEYPFYSTNPEISYLKALKIKTNTGKTLIYSDEFSDFEIEATTYAPSTNGLGEGLNKMPASGTNFYIKFTSEKAGNVTGITMSAECEYLDSAAIKHQSIYSFAKVYRYLPYDGRTDTFSMTRVHNVVRFTIRGLKYQEDKTKEPEGWDWDCSCSYYDSNYDNGDGTWGRDRHYGDDGGNPPKCNHCGTKKKPIYPWDYIYGEEEVTYSFDYEQPYLLMSFTPVGENEPQDFTLAGKGYRKYKVVEVNSTTPPPDIPKDETIDFNGMKKWDEKFDVYNNKITEITVSLVRNGTTIATQKVTEENGWRYSFKNLPKYDSNHKEYNYFVIDNVSGYATKTNGSSVVNEPGPTTDNDKTEREVKKYWNDSNNQFKVRPASVTVKLERVNYKGEVDKTYTVTLSEGNNWYHKFENLEKYEKVGDIKYEYVYRLKEDPIEHYITSYNGNEIINTYGDFKVSIELGGFVWVDINSGKEDVANGEFDTTFNSEYTGSETLVPNVTVRIYRKDGKNLPNGKKYMETKTDKYGKYVFQGLDPSALYKIEFTYNGQYYEATTYASSSTWSNPTAWKKNSNAKEDPSDRTKLNNKFAAIGATPNNYGENKRTYTWDELWENNIVDFAGNIEPWALSSSDSDIKSMVQFVQDCQISADTAESYYPVSTLNKFFEGYEYKEYLDKLSKIQSGASVSTAQLTEFDRLRTKLMGEATTNIQQIYDNAYYINLGLHPRQITDVEVIKDIAYVTEEINGQKEVYDYDKIDKLKCLDCGYEGKLDTFTYKIDSTFRWGYHCPKCDGMNHEKEWNVELREADMFSITDYNREIREADYLYDVDSETNGYGADYQYYGKDASDELEVYVTYKVSVVNQSLSIKTRIDEIVDYFDKEYEFVPERSYAQINEDKYKINSSSSSMYSTLNSPTEKSTNKYDKVYITGVGKQDSSKGIYVRKIDDQGNETQANGVYLGSGDQVDFYLTFRVLKKDGKVILDKENEGKENFVELNGYSTMYHKGVKIPNIYPEGVPEGISAGIIDINSTPGNLEAETDGSFDVTKFENDTNKAPDLYLQLMDGGDRIISGSVWDDERTKTVLLAKVADGIWDKEKEAAINGVTVELVELMDNGTEYVWRKTMTGPKTDQSPIINEVGLITDTGINGAGEYAFKSFVPGKYIVRFTYGDSEYTVINKDVAAELGKNQDDYNLKSYNGQDYKSTTYQADVNQNAAYEDRNTDIWNNENIDGNVDNNRLAYKWRADSEYVNGQEILGKILTTIATYKADCSNNSTVNMKDVYNKEITVQDQDGYLYDIAESEKYNGTKAEDGTEYANVSDAKDIKGKLDETGKYAVGTRGYVNTYSGNNGEGTTNHLAEVLASHKADYMPSEGNRTELLEELWTNTKMTAETGLMVIELEYVNPRVDGIENDNTYQIQNVNLGLEERPKAQLELDKKVTNVNVALANGSLLFDAKDTDTNVLWKKHKELYEGDSSLATKYFDSLEQIAQDRLNKVGLIQLTMDEEIMHGATINLDYEILVKNVGEVDYLDDSFYYKGMPTSEDVPVVTTSANEIVDYVANNLQFSKNENQNYWEQVKTQDLLSGNIKDRLLNSSLTESVSAYNTVIVSDQTDENLVPKYYKINKDTDQNDSISIPLKLSQLITSENDTDDLTYKNIAEVLKVSNTVGRRMEYSIVGNQNPQEDPQEMDSDMAENVRILPPFGENSMYVIISIVSIISIGIIVVAIIFIKKKIIK